MLAKSSVAILTAVICGFCPATNAETIKFQVPACITNDLLSEFTRYIINQDSQGAMQLVYSGNCIVLTEGDHVSVIHRGFSTSTVRIDGAKYYLVSEALGKSSSNQHTPPLKMETQPPPEQKHISPQINETQMKKPNPDIGKVRLQTISTESKESSEETAKQLQQLGYQSSIRTLVINKKTVYRVYTEAFQEKEKAIEAKKQIDQALKTNSLILKITD